MKRIFTIVFEGQEKDPVLIVADSLHSAYAYACLSVGSHVIAVQAGPEVKIAE